jgi:hypothetical protein
MSSGRENSRGEWLMPPMLGTKIIPTDVSRAMSCASWPAPLGINFVDRPSSFAESPMSWRIRGSVGAGIFTLISLKSKLVLLV